jgi:hypothetical protein
MNQSIPTFFEILATKNREKKYLESRDIFSFESKNNITSIFGNLYESEERFGIIMGTLFTKISI